MLDGMLDKFVRQYGWIHLGIGLLGNSLFVVGSLLFLFEYSRTIGTVFFLAGSIGMLLGRIGEVFAHGLDQHWKMQREEARDSSR